MDQKMWLVRADSGNLFEDFRNKNLVGIGWINDTPMRYSITLDQIKEALRSEYSSNSNIQIGNWASQINLFINEISIGDWILTYEPDDKIYLIGKFCGFYEFNGDLCSHHHIRRVIWKDVLYRPVLSEETKTNIGRPPTVFEINFPYKAEILHLIQ